jgi:deazaflavin-dependent oxidoreductase (nitroreductase family)
MPFPRALSRLTRPFDDVALHFAGHAAFADLEHVGRRSGVVYHTPVRAFRRGDKVVVGLNFGRGSAWLKNIQAAGRCRMRLSGRQLELRDPQLVPVREGVTGMPWLFRFALRHVARTEDCVQLSVVSSAPDDKPRGRRAQLRTPRAGRRPGVS